MWNSKIGIQNLYILKLNFKNTFKIKKKIQIAILTRTKKQLIEKIIKTAKDIKWFFLLLFLGRYTRQITEMYQSTHSILIDVLLIEFTKYIMNWIWVEKSWIAFMCREFN